MTARPAPPVGRDNAYYWEGIAAGRVLIQLCTACGKLRHPPSPMCPACQSLDWGTVAATGRAYLHSYTVCHHPLPPWETGPYTVVLADLDVEGSPETVRIVCGVQGLAPEDLAIGMPLRLDFADGLVFVTGEETAP